MSRGSLVQLPAELLRPRPGGAGHCVMGIDGGATKTLAAVLDLDSKRLHFARGGPSNEDAIGAQAAVAVLIEVAESAMARAGIGPEALLALVVAVAGTDTQNVTRHVRAARGDDWIVVNDVVAAWATATGAQPGVGVIAGTGSNVFGVGPTGETWRTGGWGHLLGDEGSAFWLGLHSIRAALRERDGSGPPTTLSEAVVRVFGARRIEDVAALTYSKPLTKRDIAAFAVETGRLANAGDEVARELYARGARELGAQSGVVMRKTGLAAGGEEQDFDVGLIGGAFGAGAVFVDPLAAAVRSCAPRARVSVVQMAPVGGSLLLAAHACGRPLDRSELSPLLEEALREEP